MCYYLFPRIVTIIQFRQCFSLDSCIILREIFYEKEPRTAFLFCLFLSLFFLVILSISNPNFHLFFYLVVLLSLFSFEA